MDRAISVVRRRTAAWLGSLVVLAVAMALITALSAGTVWAETNDRSVASEPTVAGSVPGQALGSINDAEIWRTLRRGVSGTVSIPNKQAGVLVQSEGDNWRAWRNGPITKAGGWILGGMLGLLVLFFALRGRIRIDAGSSGKTIERFNNTERFAHWLTASCFIVLALTGLNMLYGRNVLLPVLGPEAFSALTLAGKYAHNFLSFGFMAGLVLMFLLWVRDNIPNKYDMFWIGYGGGLFSKGLHPPAPKFNAGQKMVFWAVILGGLSMSLSGLALLFPFEFSLFDATFRAMNAVGFQLPTGITAMQEMQLSQISHSVVGLLMTAVILGHIYIGTLGMEGAFDAVGSGQVDENWAREHHAVWVAELKGEPLPEPDDIGGEKTQPAE